MFSDSSLLFISFIIGW